MHGDRMVERARALARARSRPVFIQFSFQDGLIAGERFLSTCWRCAPNRASRQTRSGETCLTIQ